MLRRVASSSAKAKEEADELQRLMSQFKSPQEAQAELARLEKQKQHLEDLVSKKHE